MIPLMTPISVGGVTRLPVFQTQEFDTPRASFFDPYVGSISKSCLSVQVWPLLSADPGSLVH